MILQSSSWTSRQFYGMLQVLNYIVPGTKVVKNQQTYFSYQAKILITNQKVDLTLKK
jgi:hypothetical protein